jgi:hypothetical protein
MEYRKTKEYNYTEKERKKGQTGVKEMSKDKGNNITRKKIKC